MRTKDIKGRNAQKGQNETKKTRAKKNPGRGDIFNTRPDRPWGPPSLLYNGYRVSFPGRGVNHPLPSKAEVKEKVEL